MLKLVVIEDETRTREAIINIIKQQCDTVEVVGSGNNITSGIEAIQRHKPDIITVDVELSDGTVFEILKQTKTLNFQIIFITAHEGYALQAIKFGAFDYLLKPFSNEELLSALNNASERIKKEKSETSFEALLSHIENREDKKIVLKTADDIHLINVNSIVSCEADSSYTSFMLKDGRQLTVSGNLKGFEEMLAPYSFFRVHHSQLVNLNEIKKYHRSDGGYVLMSDGRKIPVSNRKKEGLIEKFNTL